MTNSVEIEVSPRVSEAAIRQLVQALGTGGKQIATALAKELGIESEVKLKARIDGREVKVFQEESVKLVDQLASAITKSNAAQENSVTSLRQQVNQAKKLRDATSKIETGVNQYGQQVIRTSKAWDEQNRKVKLLQRQLELLSANSFFDKVKSGLNLGGLAQAGQNVSQLVNTFQSINILVQQAVGALNLFVNAAKNLESIQLTFQAIGQGSQGAAIALDESSRIALNLGADLKSVRTGFQQLSPVILQSGGSLQDVSKITQALSSRFAVFGKSADESRRIMNAVVQAFGKGKLMSEELNQQIAEADPAFRVDLANAIGVTVAELGKMVEEGQITNDVLLKAIPLLDKSAIVYGKLGRSASEAATKIGTVGVTITQIQSKINTINQLSLERATESFDGLNKAVIGIQAAVADFFDVLTKSTAFKVFADVVELLATSVLEIIKALTKLLEIVLLLLEPFARLIEIITKNEAIMKLLAVVVGILLAGKLALMARAAFAGSAALTNLAKAALLGQKPVGGFGAALAGIAKDTKSSSKLFPAIGKGLQSLGLGAGQAGINMSKLTPILNKVGLGAQTGGYRFRDMGKAAIELAKKPSSIGPAFANAFGKINSSGASASASLKNFASTVKQGAITTGAWGRAVANSLLPFTKGKGFTAAQQAYKAVNASSIVYTGQTIKASTAAATFATRTQAAYAALKGTAAGTNALVSAIGNVTVKGLGLAIGRFVLFSQAIDTSINVISNYSSAFAPAAAATAAYSKAIKSAQETQNQFNQVIKAGGKPPLEWATEATNRTNAWQNSLEKTTRYLLTLGQTSIPLVTAESASWVRQTTAILDGEDKLNKILDENVKKFAAYASASDGSKESINALSAGTKLLVDDLDAQTSALEATLAAAQAEKPATEAGLAAKLEQIAALEAEISLNKSARKELIAIAAARGVDVSAMDEQLRKKDQLITKLKEELEAIKKVNEKKISKLESSRDEDIATIDKIAKSRTEAIDKEIKQIERIKSATEKRWSAEDSLRTRNQQLADRAYDAEIRKLDQIGKAIDAAYNKRIGQLQQQTPAESQLAALDKRELEREAAQGETQRDRLQAKAQLERMEREKEIAKLEKQREAEKAALEEKRAAMEEKRRIEKEKQEDEAYAREVERNAQREAWESAIQKKREEQATIEAKAEESKRKIAEIYNPEIAKLEGEIAAAAEKLEKAEGEREKRLEELKRQGDAWLKIRERDLVIAERIAELESGRKPSGGNTPPPKPAGGGMGGRRGSGSSPSTRFAGGPVAGGTPYTVNELGREAFLSNSGKLSYINAPAWGTWTAPGSGTVIPAHITAGLDIPTGGTRVGSGPAAAAAATPGRRVDSLARMLGAALGAPQGRVTNNVTIQSTNTTKAASDILVELTKIKRNRYR